MAARDGVPKVTRRRFLAWSTAAAASAGLAPLLSACSQPAAPAPAAQQPASGSAPAPAAPTKAVAPTQPPAKAGVIELKLDHHEPAQGNVGKTYQMYADLVGEKSGGRIHITVYPSETLGKAADSYPNCINGISDIAWTPIGFLPGQFPLTEAFNLPMNGITSAKHGAKAAIEWFKTNPILQKEWEAVHVIAAYCNGICFLNSAKKPIRKIEDVAGMKIRATGFGNTTYLKVLNANPVAFPPPELFEALSKGIVDGYIWDWQGILGNRTYELTKYAMTMPIVNSFMGMIMNKKKYESLPPDLQQIIDNPPGLTWQPWDPINKGPAPSLSEFFSNAFDIADPPGLEAFLKNGGEEIKHSPEEAARWREAAKPVWKAYAESMQGKGFDAAKELENIQAIIAKHAPKS